MHTTIKGKKKENSPIIELSDTIILITRVHFLRVPLNLFFIIEVLLIILTH